MTSGWSTLAASLLSARLLQPHPEVRARRAQPRRIETGHHRAHITPSFFEAPASPARLRMRLVVYALAGKSNAARRRRLANSTLATSLLSARLLQPHPEGAGRRAQPRRIRGGHILLTSPKPVLASTSPAAPRNPVQSALPSSAGTSPDLPLRAMASMTVVGLGKNQLDRETFGCVAVVICGICVPRRALRCSASSAPYNRSRRGIEECRRLLPWPAPTI